MSAPATHSATRRPERKWGPFHGGVNVCVWLNEVDTEAGRRLFRSVTIGARRYRDPATSEWKDAGSFQPTDIPSLLLSLQAAHDFMTTMPLPQSATEVSVGTSATESAVPEDPIPF